MISLVSIFNEITTKEKPLYNSGAQHNVYQSKHNPNILYKIGDHVNTLKWVNLFKKHPKYFPKIYKTGFITSKENGLKFTDMYVAIEKLDTKQVYQEWVKLEEGLIGTGYITEFETVDYYLKEALQDQDFENEMGEALKTFNIEIYKLFLKWMTFLSFVNNLVSEIKISILDVHDGNFGYDNKGNLKCLDI